MVNDGGKSLSNRPGIADRAALSGKRSLIEIVSDGTTVGGFSAFARTEYTLYAIDDVSDGQIRSFNVIPRTI